MDADATNPAPQTGTDAPSQPAPGETGGVEVRGPAMMTAIPGGADSALPGPLGERQFAGELEDDFESALLRVRADGPRTEERRGLWSSIARALGIARARHGRVIDRHVAFDGYVNPNHDEKIERDRRYGTVYTVVERANAYLVRVELPRRIPASSLKELWKLPDEMPDYDYSLALHDRVLVVRAGVRGEAMRRLSYISASFPSDFLTRVEFERQVSSFKHRLRDKTIETIVFKTADTRSAAGAE